MGNEEPLKPSVPESQGLEGYTQMFCLIITPENVAGVPGPWEHLALEVHLGSLSVRWGVKSWLHWDLHG